MEKKVGQIGLLGQTILAVIPSIVTQLIAFYRINQFKKGGLIELGLGGLSIGINMLLPWPYGLVVILVITIVIPVYYVRKWTEEFNAKVGTSAT